MDPIDFNEDINRRIKRAVDVAQPERMATVTDVASEGIQIKIDGEAAPRGKYYMHLSGYINPQVGDRVIAVRLGGTYVVYGNVV